MRDSSLSRRTKARRQHRLTPPEQLETRRLLAVFNVNSFQDTVDVDLTDGLALDAAGNTSLRAAIMQANWSPGDDEINLPAGNYPLELLFSDPDNFSTDNAGDLDITDDTGLTTIRGAGAESTTIDATAVSERVLHVHSGAELDLSGVALVGGFESEGLGGGLLLEGASTLQGIHVDSNRAAFGGGIFDRSGELIITQSTISNNTAIIDGGGIAFGASFSGPDGAASGITSLINSTVSGNSATRGGGGGIAFDSSVNRNIGLTHVTIASNSAMSAAGVSGPIFEPSMVTVQASIIADNFSPDELDLGGVFTSQGSNVIGASEPESGFLDGENNDLVGSPFAPIDPLLQPLSAFTFSPLPVHRLRLASPAVDRVDLMPIPAQIDQRNRSRSLDAAPDSGAFEFVGGTILVDTFHDLNRNASRDLDESSALFDFELFVSGELVDGSTLQFSSTGYAPLTRLEEGVYSIEANFFDTDRVLPTLTDATIMVSEEFIELAEFAGYRYGEIYGYKFGDRWGDSQDDDDPRLEGIHFDLIELGMDGQLGTPDDRLVGQSTTDEGGAFSFHQLLDGNYRVIENLPQNRISTTSPIPSLQVTAGSLFSPFESPEADPLQTVVVEPTLAVGNALPAALRGRVFFDVDRDGFDPTDPGISTFSVSLSGAGPDGEFGSDDDPAPLTTVSAADGTYSFDAVATPGSYRIALTLRDQYFSTTASSLQLDLRLNDVVISDPGRSISLAEDQTELINQLLNFGVSRTAAIQGTIFDDLNADGNRFHEEDPPVPDADENGRGGQRIDLYRQQPSGEFLWVDSALSVNAPGTPQHGFFEFAVLEAGIYAVDQILMPDRGLTSSEAPFEVQPGRYYVSTTIDASGDAVQDFEEGIVPLQPVALLDAGSRGLVELTGNIGDDPDANGIRSVDEAGLAGWQVVLQRTERLYHQDEFPDTRSITTDAEGNYSLFVWPGQYEIAQLLEPGFEPTGPQYRFENYQGVASGSGTSVSKVSGLTLADLDGDSMDDLVVVNDFADITDRTSSLEVHYSNSTPSSYCHSVKPYGHSMLRHWTLMATKT